MAKSKAVMALEAQVAALEARLVVAKQVYASQRARIAELEAVRASHGHILVAQRPAPEPKVTQFTKRDGSRWESVRVGNQTRTRMLSN